MRGEVHEISAALGRLEAQVAEASRQRQAIFLSLEEINRRLADFELARRDFGEVKLAVSDYRRLKQRGLGVLIGLVIAAGMAGASLKELWIWAKGWGH